MFFPTLTARRRNPTFVRVPLHTRTFKRASSPQPVICSATPPPPPSVPTPPPKKPTPNQQPVQQITERLATARERSRQLHTRLVARLVESATQHVQSILSSHSHGDSAQAASTARRLRRDLRSLRAAVDVPPADNSVWVSITRLQSLVEDLERRADSDSAFVRDSLQEDIEGGMRAPDDIGEFDDDPPVQSAGWRQPAAGIRRKVSNVGEVIEGGVAKFIRRDGTIDVDGLRGFVRGVLDSIGTTWMRLNGHVTSPASRSLQSSSTVAAPSRVSQLPSMRDEEREFHLREEIGELEKKLFDTSKEREKALRKEDQLGKLMRAKEIRLMDDSVSALRRTLAVRVLQLELEKILIGVAEEIDSAEYETILDQRVLVVEFGDLDERLATLDLFVEQDEPLLIDDDIVGELAADMQDLKMRLGLDAPLYSSATMSLDQVRQFLASSSKKTRAGFEFYSRGLRLFAGDVRFAWRLVRRTMTGYTPSGREVRTLRRTGRDLLTLVPFTIVLIAPLTPVGHVLIFSFLQKYWPEFFPSTFSERRQTIMKKREQYLKMLETEDESEDDGIDDDDDNGQSGMMDSLQRLVNFGNLGGETSEGSTRSSGMRSLESTEKNGVSDDTNSSEVSDLENDGERSVALSDLADSVLDRDRKARKQRNTVALDELHLAD